MKYLTRFCSVLLCFVLLFGVFSINASAVSNQHNIQVNVTNSAGTYLATGSYMSGTGYANIYNDYDVLENINSSSIFVTDMYLSTDNATPIVEKGHSFDLGVYGLNFYVGIAQSSILPIGNKNISAFRNFYVVALYDDGSTEFLHSEDSKTFILNNSLFDVNLSGLTAKKNITKLWLQFICSPYHHFGLQGPTQYYLGYHHQGGLDVKIDSAELSTSKSILSKITDGFSKINDGFSNMLKSLVELPIKIGSAIGDMIKSLFVPSTDDFSDLKNKWDTLLSSRFGAVYEVSGLIVNMWQDIDYADESNTIIFPLVSIPLPEGENFSFGGYEVKIIPDGFESVATILKSIIGISCTFLFINALRKRYDEVMGVEK